MGDSSVLLIDLHRLISARQWWISAKKYAFRKREAPNATTLNPCEACGKEESDHQKAGHPYRRDNRVTEWHGWHAARRGLGSNLYRLGVPDMVIQRILRHANVSTTATYYIKTAADDVRKAMTTLENHIAEAGPIQSETNGTQESNLTVGTFAPLAIISDAARRFGGTGN